MKPGWTGVHGMLYVKGNYQLLIDNILDLTHVVFVHKTTLAGGGVAETPLEVEIDGDVVRAQRLMRDVDTAPIYKAARNLHGKIDRWQFLEFRPPIYARITLGAREAGSEVPFGTPTHIVLNSFTPETERTTHYFWSTVRSWGLEDANVSKIYKDMDFGQLKRAPAEVGDDAVGPVKARHDPERGKFCLALAGEDIDLGAANALGFAHKSLAVLGITAWRRSSRPDAIPRARRRIWAKRYCPRRTARTRKLR